MEDSVDKSKFLDVLMKRDLERKLDLQKKKDTRKSGTAENEKVEIFQKMFTENALEIENLLSNVKNIPENDLPEYFNTISKQILTLQKFVASSNIFLRTYDIKRYQNRIQLLTNKSKELEEKLLPKKKFGFKNKKNLPSNGHSEDVIDMVTKKHLPVIGNTCDHGDKNGDHIIMNSDEVLKKDVALQNLRNCCVEIRGSPSTLHLSKISNCFIFVGPVSTSVFAEDCCNSTFVIACQQLRLHSSKNVKVYLHVTSRAIIEDSSEICLAPYNWKYDGVEDDFKRSGLDVNVNNWKSVDDFNWLNLEKASPNWRLLNDVERVENWGAIVKQN